MHSGKSSYHVLGRPADIQLSSCVTSGEEDWSGAEVCSGIIDRARAQLQIIPVGSFGSMIPTGVVAWVLHDRLGPISLWAWISSVLIAHAVRLFIWFRAKVLLAASGNAARCLSRLRASVALLGCSWALLPIFVVPRSNYDELLVAAVIAAVSGAGVAQLASDAWSAGLFIGPSIAAVILRLISSMDASLQAVGLLVALYFAFLLTAALRIQASFLQLSSMRRNATRRSLRDALTGLPNRVALQSHLQAALARAQRDSKEVAVCYLDLDDFKDVNDKFGHVAGDNLLRGISQRWRTQLRRRELMARLGGDEFVLVVDDIDPANALQQLVPMFDRLHAAAIEPIVLAPLRASCIGITMGVARFPHDGRDGDQLLRLADVAMYQLKQRKKSRANWWQIGVVEGSLDQPEPPLDAYGVESRLLFTEYGALLRQINSAFVEDFYRDLEKDPASLALLKGLTADELAHLKRRQSDYLSMLVDPSTTREMLLEHASRVGKVHLLGGVSGSMLARASTGYRSLLTQHLGVARLPLPRRYRLLRAFEQRMQDELHAEFSAAEGVSRAYLEAFSRDPPAPGARWSDVSQGELDFLARLPGVVVVALTRLRRSGELIVEASAFAPGVDPTMDLFAPEGLPQLHPDSPRGQSATARAWRTQEIARIDSWVHDERVAPWREVGLRLGIKSHVSIPFSGRDGHLVGVVGLFGRQTAQFASAWMLQWCAGLRRRLEIGWGRCRAPAREVELSQEAAQRYRDRLFAGGLEMFVQPMVDLHTGRIHHVEALARLRMPGGEVVSPGVFLPPLGEIELDRVFRMGLDQALDALRRWESQGLTIDLSLNLPPSTLVDPECAQWIEEALRKRHVAPHRLTLELLETQEFDSAMHGRAIEALRDRGVCLAIDDLGTGYSNIERIAASRFDVIKIDQTLIRRIYDNPLQTITLVGSLVLLGRDLGQRVVVEGIEDRAMLEVATAFGADQAQGYLFAAPMPSEALPHWVVASPNVVTADSRQLGTFAGALAYHWRHIHLGETQALYSAAECPVGRFLESQAGCAEGVRLHARAHIPGPAKIGGTRELLTWIAARVRPP